MRTAAHWWLAGCVISSLAIGAVGCGSTETPPVTPQGGTAAVAGRLPGAGTSGLGASGAGGVAAPVVCGAITCPASRLAGLPAQALSFLPTLLPGSKVADVCCTTTQVCGFKDPTTAACNAPIPADTRCPAVSLMGFSSTPCCTAADTCGSDLGLLSLGCYASALAGAPRSCSMPPAAGTGGAAGAAAGIGGAVGAAAGSGGVSGLGSSGAGGAKAGAGGASGSSGAGGAKAGAGGSSGKSGAGGGI
jgi:hypothetical protein